MLASLALYKCAVCFNVQTSGTTRGAMRSTANPWQRRGQSGAERRWTGKRWATSRTKTWGMERRCGANSCTWIHIHILDKSNWLLVPYISAASFEKLWLEADWYVSQSVLLSRGQLAAMKEKHLRWWNISRAPVQQSDSRKSQRCNTDAVNAGVLASVPEDQRSGVSLFCCHTGMNPSCWQTSVGVTTCIYCTITMTYASTHKGQCTV